MRSSSLFFSFLLTAGLFVSCGYKTATNQFGLEVAEVSVPLIKGDENGSLRFDVARQVAETSGYNYCSNASARYRLDIKIDSDKKETIGYAWDEQPITGAFIKRLYPNEGRRKVKATASLYDTVKKKVVISPFSIEEFADYDFVNPTALKNIEFSGLDGDKHSVLQYSMGQLDSEEGARLESFQPLSQALAVQIMSALRRAPVVE